MTEEQEKLLEAFEASCSGGVNAVPTTEEQKKLERTQVMTKELVGSLASLVEVCDVLACVILTVKAAATELKDDIKDEADDG